MMKIAIVIPCLNEKNYIERCLRSIADQREVDLSLVEVFVVDGGSADGTIEVLAACTDTFHFLRVLHNPLAVTPISLNLGLKAAKADFKMILGAHSVLHDLHLSEVLSAFRQYPEAGCVGGMIKNVYENKVAAYIGMAMSSPFGVGDATFRTGGKDGYVDTVAFGVYRKEVFESVGYFDEELARNQDDEFNYRLTNAGFRIFFTNRIVSSYYVRGSIQKLFKQYFQYGYWKVFVNKKHGVVTSIRQLVPLFFVVYLLICALLWIVPMPIYISYSFIPLYFLGALYFAVKKTNNPTQIVKVIQVFFILHFSYGMGYLKGIKDFILLNRKPRQKHVELSR